MRFIPPTPAPAFFTEFVQEHLRQDPDGSEPRRGLYPPAVRARLLNTLHQQFSGKCAYCESALGVSGSENIDHFRPLSLYGMQAALDWHNLLLACPVCDRNKAGRFPLERREFYPELHYNQRLGREFPVLLHPRIDRPDEHLRFSEDGVVHGLTDRGVQTIALLDLNRLQLVETRKLGITQLFQLPRRNRHRAVTPATPYSASLAHVLRAHEDSAFLGEIDAARLRQTRSGQDSAPVATDKGEGLDQYRQVARYIERVELKNIGPLTSLELNLLGENQARTPGFALLGENGIGKSTILRAIACALAGPAYARKLRLTSNSLLAAGAASGAIMVRVTGYPEPIRVTLRRGRPLGFNTPDAKALVLAYGASRLLATGRHKAEEGMRHAKMRNLFDPFVPVGDASAWLDLVRADRLEDVRTTLERILNEAPEGPVRVVSVDDGRLRFAIGAGPARPVTALSDGDKSLIGIAGDIMAVMHSAGFERMEEAMGVVLVDELGNHFHPQLKLRIVTALRSAFPRIQFIYSTHEPLCLRGMASEEVAVLRRDEAGVYLLTDLPDVATMRIDQLLASEHFGLGSTVDPQRVAEIRRYHVLVRSSARSADEDQELNDLRRTLADADYLGGSRRERMLLSLLDMHAGELPRTPGEAVSAKELSRRTVNRLTQILQAIGPVDASAAAPKEAP